MYMIIKKLYVHVGVGCSIWSKAIYIWRSWSNCMFYLSLPTRKYSGNLFLETWTIYVHCSWVILNSSCFEVTLHILFLSDIWLPVNFWSYDKYFIALQMDYDSLFVSSLFFLQLLMERSNPGCMILRDLGWTIILWASGSLPWLILLMEQDKMLTWNSV